VTPPASADASIIDEAPKFSIRGLNVWYGRQQALADVTLDLAAGRVTAVIGPSGCGKSTFLRVLDRLCDDSHDQTVTGQVLLDGVDIFGPQTDPMILRGRVGMVFQESTVFPMSIFNNVAFGIRLQPAVSAGDVRDGVESSLKRAALWDEVKDLLATPAKGLSGGQQQRLCIARALATGPEVLLCDEPTSALDPVNMELVEHLMTDLKATVTVVLVTHNMNQAKRVADNVAFLSEGRLVECGTAADVFERPKAKRLADYLAGTFG
jgi:phosphate transport system ATP-binding protein